MTMKLRETAVLAASLLALCAVAAPARSQGPDADSLTMSREERVRDHEDREQQIKKRIAEAEARYRTEASRPTTGGPRRSGVASLMAPFAPSEADSARRALSAFHAALDAYERTGRSSRVTVLQIGDSHTAGDNMTGFLRERLQRRFADGGRGMLAPGKPFFDFRPYQLRVAQSPGWGVYNYRQWTGTGIASYSIVGDKKDESIDASMRGLKSFEIVEVEFVRQRDGGSFTVVVDGQPVRTVSARGGSTLDRVTIELPRPGYHATVTLKGDGPVALLSWSLLRRRGLVLVSHGVPGETSGLMSKWDRNIAAWQIHHLNPALIIIAFGTNEGFDTRFRPEDYESDYRARLEAVQAMAPQASIVVMTAPDAARLPSWCGRTRAQRENFRCHALEKGHADNYAELIDRKSKELCYWHSPPALEKVRAIQRRVAARIGAYFWDWSQVMRGECGMDRWARMDPPLTIADRVHMRLEGYDLSAEALYRDLMRDYSAPRR